MVSNTLKKLREKGATMDDDGSSAPVTPVKSTTPGSRGPGSRGARKRKLPSKQKNENEDDDDTETEARFRSKEKKKKEEQAKNVTSYTTPLQAPATPSPVDSAFTESVSFYGSEASLFGPMPEDNHTD